MEYIIDWMDMDYMILCHSLTASEVGAFFLLVHHAAARGGSLPTLGRGAANVLNISDEDWRILRPRMRPLFFKSDDGWHPHCVRC